MPDPAPTPAAETTLPIESVSSSPAGELDFFSAIDRQFEAAEKGETVTSPAEVESKTESKPQTPAPEKPATETTPARPASPKAKDFDLIKTQRDEARAASQKLEEQLKDLQEKLRLAETGSAELPTVKEKLSKYEKEVSAFRVESSPEYDAAVGAPARKIRDAATILATKYKIDPAKLVDAFAEADLSRQSDLASQLAEGMNQRDQIGFYQLVDDFNAVMAKKAELQANSEKAWEEIQHAREQEAQRASQAQAAAWKAAESAVWKKIEERIPHVGKLTDIGKLREAVTSTQLSKLTPEEQVYSSVSGRLLPHFVNAARTAENRVKELEAVVASYNRATPGAGAGSPAASATQSDESGDFLASIERRLAGG